MRITSNAKWTKIPDSWDRHDTVSQAQNVCDILKEDYEKTPCEIRGLCIESWVEIDGTRQN